MLRPFFAAAVIASALVVSCSIYDTSLLVGTASSAGGDATSISTTTTTSSLGGAGTMSSSTMSDTTSTATSPVTSVSVTTGGNCAQAVDCGTDTECLTFTCASGVCGTSFTPVNTALAAQTAGDCQTAVCDGSGGITSMNDDSDVEDDMKECTVDTCSGGAPVHTSTKGSPCAGGAKVCTSAGECVECVADADCSSGACNQATNTCSMSTCTDGIKNGNETAKDCGGSCPPCALGDVCGVDADCLSHKCAGTCQPSCTDGFANEGESDIDCGGPNCGACAIGLLCGGGSDCVSGACSGGVCVCNGTHLVIGEIKTRGVGGGGDEFVEIYNPEASDVVLDTTWKVDARGWNTASYTVRWTSPGITIPAHAHFLIAGSSYTGPPAKDASLSSGISDSASVRLVQNGNVVDSICFYFNTTSQTAVTGFGCEGLPISNLPHNDTTAGSSNTDASLERKPGGVLGNCTDTDNNSADFQPITPSKPQDLASATTP